MADPESRRAAVRRREARMRANLDLDGSALVARGTCLRKNRFPTEAQAREAMTVAGAEGAATYHCPLCELWHFGHPVPPELGARQREAIARLREYLIAEGLLDEVLKTRRFPSRRGVGRSELKRNSPTT